MHKDSHTEPLHDATALMADEARTQSQQSVHKEANDKCSFAKISENNKDWCNGRGKPAPLRKASGIVQMHNHISTQTIAV